MKKCMGLVISFLSISSAFAGEEVKLVAAIEGNEEAAVVEVTKENYADLISVLYEKGGRSLLKRELARLLNQEAYLILNPHIEGQDAKLLPIEYSEVVFEKSAKDGEELMKWFLRHGADSNAKNRLGNSLKDMFDEAPFDSVLAHDRKRKKVEPFVIDALQGISVEELVGKLTVLVEKDKQIKREDVILILGEMMKESEKDTAVISELLSAYRGQPAVKSGGRIDVPSFLGGVGVCAVGFYVFNKYIKPAVETA